MMHNTLFGLNLNEYIQSSPGIVIKAYPYPGYSASIFRVTEVPGKGCCCCCCCGYSHINSHNQVRGHRTGSSHSGAEEYPRENTHNPRWYTHISPLTQFMPPPELYKSEIGSHSTMCQVHACCAFFSLLTPGETNYYNNILVFRLPPKQGRLPRIYITRSIYHYAYARQA